MLFKYAMLFISGLSLCLIIMAASAQTPEENRQAVQADLRALDESYRQLQQDRLAGNAAGVELGQDNIAVAEQDFRSDIQRALAADQKNLAADQQALDALNQKLQQDINENPAAVVADKEDISAAQQKLREDSAQTIADDGLQVALQQRVLDNENWQLQQDLKGPVYAMSSAVAIQADMQSVKQAAADLQEAQLKLQLDRNTQTQVQPLEIVQNALR